ncbi:MAG: AMP-binding protein [Oscillospiraceae bacterium]|nr:AMP-binding protein [Oscillospiraceae bacterium]
MSLIDYLTKQAKERPEQAALVCGNESLTYRALDELSTRAAYGLTKIGVQKGECIGISTDHDIQTILAVFSVIKAGGMFVPLSPSLPYARKTFIKNNAQIKVDFGVNADVFKLSETRHEIHLLKPKGDEPLAVMYTSGSTGEPKGVILLHKNPLAAPRHYNKIMKINAADNVANYVSLSFIVALNDIAYALEAGATLHIIRDDIRLDVRAVADYFNKNNIVSALMPVSFGRWLADETKLETLKSLGLCGERFKAPKPENREGYEVFNIYGTTEICGAQFAGREAVMPMGDIKAELDKNILTVSGDCVAYGYIGGANFNGSYSTGDLAEQTRDGFLIKGREDFQIKLRAYRIEPNDIDMKILTVNGVNESVTVKSNERLVNFFSGTALIDDIKAKLTEQLPKYMLPSEFIRLESLPKTLTGKINRAALPSCESSSESLINTLHTQTEKRLATIWVDILGMSLSSISAHDDFESCGGDSLRLVILSIEIEKQFGITITPWECLKAKTIRKQAKLIEALTSSVPTTTVGNPRVCVLNQGFQDSAKDTPLWFVHTANSGPEVYRKFAKTLPQNRPFFVFENHNMLFGNSHFEGIRELASRYINELPKADFYHLGGWSFGGVIAFEMGLQLQRRGVISRLFLIDPLIGETALATPNKTDYRAYLESDPLFERFRAMGLIDKLERNNAFVLNEIANYRPSETYHGEAVLFRMTLDNQDRSSTKTKAPDNGFGNFTKNLKIININQTHDNAMIDDESLGVICEEL